MGARSKCEATDSALKIGKKLGNCCQICFTAEVLYYPVSELSISFFTCNNTYTYL